MYKNAIDAMDGRGSIEIAITALKNKIYTDIKDSGKGGSQSKPVEL